MEELQHHTHHHQTWLQTNTASELGGSDVTSHSTLGTSNAITFLHPQLGITSSSPLHADLWGYVHAPFPKCSTSHFQSVWYDSPEVGLGGLHLNVSPPPFYHSNLIYNFN